MSEKEANSLRAIIADKRLLIRLGLTAILQKEGISVMASVESDAAALDAYRLQRPDVVLLGDDVPPLDLIRVLCAESPPARIIVLANVTTSEPILQALQAGALGCMDLDDRPEDLLECLHAVHAGREWISPRTVARLDKR